MTDIPCHKKTIIDSMFFIFHRIYQTPEIKATFSALSGELIDEIEMKGSNLSWTEEEFDCALEELLSCMVNFANRLYPSEQAKEIIHHNAFCGKITSIPLKLCILYVFFGCLDGQDYCNLIKNKFDFIIAKMNISSHNKVSFNLNELQKFIKPEDEFFKIDGGDYNELYNNHSELKTKYEELERENLNLHQQIQVKEEELDAMKKHFYLNTLVDFMVDNNAKTEEKEMVSIILSRMYMQNQNEEVKEAYERLKDSISADKKNARGGNTFISVAPGGMNIGNIGRVDNLGPQS